MSPHDNPSTHKSACEIEIATLNFGLTPYKKLSGSGKEKRLWDASEVHDSWTYKQNSFHRQENIQVPVAS